MAGEWYITESSILEQFHVVCEGNHGVYFKYFWQCY